MERRGRLSQSPSEPSCRQKHASGLPATGLLFPLSLRTHEGDSGVVRTILSVDEAEHSLTFAGDVPVGSYARLMKAEARFRTGYAPKSLDEWADRARAWAEGRMPADLPQVGAGELAGHLVRW